MRAAIALLVALLVAFAGSQAFLPRLVEQRLATGIDKSIGPAERVSVQVTAFPALRLLAGQLQRLTVDVRQAELDGLKVEAFIIDAQNLVIDPQKLRRGEGVEVKAADSLRVSAVIAEEDLNAFFWERIDPSRSFSIALEPDVAQLHGSVRFLGLSIGVTVNGHFEVVQPTQVSFVVDEVKVEKMNLPRLLMDSLAKRWAVHIDLATAAVPLEISDVRVAQDRLFIYGRRPSDLPLAGGQQADAVSMRR
ncbi:MAG: DUF2993 domain-containing protein [Limnochordia bacterium]|jgi:hypothetical protein